MNAPKSKIGCLVPLCQATHCDRIRKKECALRRYFLKEINERKARYFALFHLVSERDREDLKNAAYFWRKK